MGILFNSLTLEKSPTAALFLILITFYYLLYKKITFRFILTSLLIIFSFPLLVLYYYYYGQDDIFLYILHGLFRRIFFVPLDSLYHYLLIFPDIHNYLDGRATQLFSFFHPDGSFHLSNYVAKIWWSDRFTSGSANAVYLGAFWADFSYFGVFFGTFILGYLLNWYYSLLLLSSHYKKNWIYMTSISISVPMFTFYFISSNFTTLFFTKGIIVLIFLFYFIKNINISNVK